ncbi:MAG TPA: hypothetical protein VGF69_24045 [Thermoanaerobaculia bacterium]|jgi:hypothetical protein
MFEENGCEQLGPLAGVHLTQHDGMKPVQRFDFVLRNVHGLAAKESTAPLDDATAS